MDPHTENETVPVRPQKTSAYSVSSLSDNTKSQSQLIYRIISGCYMIQPNLNSGNSICGIPKAYPPLSVSSSSRHSGSRCLAVLTLRRQLHSDRQPRRVLRLPPDPPIHHHPRQRQHHVPRPPPDPPIHRHPQRRPYRRQQLQRPSPLRAWPSGQRVVRLNTARMTED